MDPGLIAIFFLCSVALLVLLGLAWLINKMAKRPLINGAALFFWSLLAAIVGIIAYQLSLPQVTWRMGYYAGQSVAVVFPLLIAALILMLRFRRKKRLASKSTVSNTTSKPTVAPPQ